MAASGPGADGATEHESQANQGQAGRRPMQAHVYHPIDTRRMVVALHEDDMRAIDVRDHDWVRVRRQGLDGAEARLARVENIDYRQDMTRLDVRSGHPRLSRALRRAIGLRTSGGKHEDELVEIEAGPECSMGHDVLGVVQTEPKGRQGVVWVDPSLDLGGGERGTLVEVERAENDPRDPPLRGRRIRGIPVDHVVNVKEVREAKAHYVALSSSQQLLLGLNASDLQPGTGARPPSLIIRAVPRSTPEQTHTWLKARQSAAALLVGESYIAAEARLGTELDSAAGLARLSASLYEALGLTEGDWIRVHDGEREVRRRAAVERDADQASRLSRITTDDPWLRRREEIVGIMWLDGDALGELDLRRSGDTALVGRDPVQTLRSAVGSNILTAVLAFATVVVIEQSVLGLLAALLAALMVLYVAFSQQRARVRRQQEVSAGGQ